MIPPVLPPRRATNHRSASSSVDTGAPVTHLLRGTHTLCGQPVADHDWSQRDDGGFCPVCAAVPEGHVTIYDLLAVGITYRQLDHWTRVGYLRPDVANPGSGVRRTYPPDELRVAAVMGLLTRAGLQPVAAHTVARGGQLVGGVRVVLPEVLGAAS